jgi:hypothetical protein
MKSTVFWDIIHVVHWKSTSVSEEQSRALLSCSAYSLTLKMEAICYSEMSVNFQWTTWRYITEDSTLCVVPSERLIINTY